MDSKLLLVNVITLLYRESQLEANTNPSIELCKEIIAAVRLPESTMDTDRGRDVLVGLRSTALWMVENPANHTYERSVLLQRIRVNTLDEEGLYSAFESAMEDLTESAAIKRHVLEYRNVLYSHLRNTQTEVLLKQAYTALAFGRDGMDRSNFVQELMEKLEPLATGGDAKTIPSIVGSVDLEDSAEVAKLMESSQDELSTHGVMRTGWQALNRMFGEHEGIRRGESILVGALQHNYKTGFTLNIFRQVSTYNTPYMRDASKKPTLVHISAENNLNDNVMKLYIQIRENETGEPVNVSQVDPAEAARYVKERMQATGYQIKMYRVDPSDFGFRELFDLLLSLEAEGCEIHFLVLDYLNMLNKRGCQQGPAGFETRDLFRRVRNFTAPRGIAFMTPHQLSTQAKELIRSNIDDFVQEIANKGYYDSCRTVDQEVDLEIGIHIVKVNGESFLTGQRGKHRKITITAEKHLGWVLKFQPIAEIPDDINGPDLSCKKPGGGAVSSENSETWW